MDVAEPATLVMPAGTAAVIRVLAGAETSFGIRQIARMANVTAARTSDVVHRLARHGVVWTEATGGATLCRLNRRHIAAPALIHLARLRSMMLEELRTRIEEWEVKPVHASLFGSSARGDGTVTSDLDILLVRDSTIDEDDPRWAEQLAVSASELHTATGNHVAWFNLTHTELRKAAVDREPIVDEWRRDGIHLAGRSLDDLLRRKRIR